MTKKTQSRQTEFQASTANKSKYADVLSDIVMEGELHKKTRLMGWKKYRFVLRKNDLRRYSTKSFRNVMKVYHINQECHVDASGVNPLQFSLKHGKSTMYLRVENANQREEWMHALNSQIRGASKPFVSNVVKNEKEFRDVQEDRKKNIQKKRKSVIEGLKTFDVREVGSPSSTLVAKNPLDNVYAEAGSRMSISTPSNNHSHPASSNVLDNTMVNTPSGMTQRTFLRRRSRSLIRASTVDVWHHNSETKTAEADDENFEKKKQNPIANNKRIQISIVALLVLFSTILFFRHYFLLGIWYIYYGISYMVYYSFWGSIISMVFLYFCGNRFIQAICSLPGLDFIEPNIEFHLDLSKQRLQIANVKLLKRSVQFLGIESTGLQFHSLRIKEINLRFPFTKLLKGIDIGIDGIYANVKPLAKEYWEAVSDASIQSEKGTSKYLADATVAALEAKMKIFTASSAEKRATSARFKIPSAWWKVAVDDIIDTLKICISNTAIRIAVPTRRHEAVVGIEIGKVELGSVSRDAKRKRLRTFKLESLCVRTNYNKILDANIEEGGSNNEDETNTVRAPVERDDDELFEPISVVVAVELPPVMQTLMVPIHNLDENVKKHVDVQIDISSIHLKLCSIQMQTLLIISNVMNLYTDFQSKKIDQYKATIKPLRADELSNYKAAYCNLQDPKTAKESNLQATLNAMEERMSHDEIIWARWDAMDWKIPCLRKFLYLGSSLTEAQKLLVLQDFLYNKSILEFDSTNRIEENAKMIDTISLSLYLENIILDVKNSKCSKSKPLLVTFHGIGVQLSNTYLHHSAASINEGFSMYVHQVHVLAEMHLVETKDEDVATSAKVTLKQIQLESFQEQESKLRYPATISKCHDANDDDSNINLVDLDYLAFFSGKSDVKLRFVGFNIIIADRTLEIIMSSINDLLSQPKSSQTNQEGENTEVPIDDEPILIECSSIQEESCSGGFLGGSDMLVNISIKAVKIILLEDTHEVSPAAFILTLNAQTGIESSLCEETISLELKEISFRQCNVSSQHEKVGPYIWHYVDSEYSRAAPLLGFTGNDADLCAYVHTFSDTISREGEQSIFFKLEDLDLKLSISQIATLNSYVTNITKALTPSDSGMQDPNNEQEGERKQEPHTNQNQKISNRLKKQMLAAFQTIDVDNSGSLSHEEFERMLRMIFKTTLLNSEYSELTSKMLSVLDKDADGSISFDEFKSAMSNISKFGEFYGLKLKCHEYAGSMFAVPSEESGIFDRVSSLSIMSNGSSSEGSGSTKQLTKKKSKRQSIAEGLSRMTSGRKSIDEVYQRDKFWNLMEMEGIVNKTKSINGQNIVDVQKKMVRACRHYEFAKYAWEKYVAPLLIENDEINSGEDEMWVLNPSSDSGAVLIEELFSLVANYGSHNRSNVMDKSETDAKLFRMSKTVAVDIGGVYINLVNLMIPIPVPALELVIDSIEVDIHSQYHSEHDVDTWLGSIYCQVYANYYNNLSRSAEPLIENTPISVSLETFRNGTNSKKNVDENHTVVDTSFRVDETKDELPVTSIGIAVAPLRINASLSLIGLINDLSEAFDVVTASSYDSLKHSSDIGNFGGFYILSNLQEEFTISVEKDSTVERLRASTGTSENLFSEPKSANDDDIKFSGDVGERNQKSDGSSHNVTVTKTGLKEFAYTKQSMNAGISLKKKQLKESFNLCDEENKGLISLNDAEKAVYNVMDILAVPVKGYEEYVQSILKEADGNMSSEISLVEFTDAVFQLVKHLGEFQYLYNLNVLNFQFLNVKLPTNSETFAYKYEGSNADAHLAAKSVVVIRHEERSEVGTVLRFSSVLTITNDIDFPTGDKHINIMLKLPNSSEIFTIDTVERVLYVPLKWVEPSTKMLIQFPGDTTQKWREVGQGFYFLHDTDTEVVNPEFANGSFGVNVFLTREFPTNSSKIALWNLSIKPQIQFKNDLPVPIFLKLNHYVKDQDESDYPIIAINRCSTQSVYGLDVGGYTRMTLQIALNCAAGDENEAMQKTSRMVEYNLPDGTTFSKGADFYFEHPKFKESLYSDFGVPWKKQMHSINIAGTWANLSSPQITVAAQFWFRNLTGLPLLCKLKTTEVASGEKNKAGKSPKKSSEKKPPKVNFVMKDSGYVFVDKPADGALVKFRFDYESHKFKSKKIIHAECSGSKQAFTNYTDIYPGYYYEAYGNIPRSSKFRSKTGIFNLYTAPLLEPLNKYMPVTILPMYMVKNNMPFPIDVFAGNLYTDSKRNEEHACMSLQPGQTCPVYKFCNLSKKDKPKIAIRASKSNTNNRVLRWNEPIPIIYNINLVGETKYFYVQSGSDKQTKVICKASVGFDETGYNYNTIFLCFDIAKSPYRLENRSATQTMYYWQYQFQGDVSAIPPMQYRDFVLPHPSGKPILCVSHQAAGGPVKVQDLRSTRVDVDKIDTMYSIRQSGHNCYCRVKADGFVKVIAMGDTHTANAEEEERPIEELLLSKQYRLDLQVGAIVLAVADATPKEIVEISLNELQVRVYNNSWRLKLLHLQADDLRKETQLPVVIEPAMTGYNTCRISGYDLSNGLIPALEVKYDYFRPLGSKSENIMVKSGVIEIADLNLNVELGYIMNDVVDVYWKLYPLPTDPTLAAFLEFKRACFDMVKPYIPSQSEECTYFEFFGMPSFRISLSLLNNVDTEDKNKPGGLSTFLGNGLGGVVGGIVGDLDISIALNTIKRKNEFLTQTDIIWDTISSYTSDIKRQLLGIVFHAEIFGDVTGLAEGLQIGFASAGENLMRGKGISAMKSVGQTISQGAVGGTFNAIGHVTNAAGNALKKMAYIKDREDGNAPAQLVQGINQGVKVFGKSIADGFAGVALRPYEGAKNNGVKGFALGIGRGIKGLIAAPIVGSLGLVEKIAVGASNTTHLHDKMYLVGTRRPYRVLTEIRDDGSKRINPVKSLLEDSNKVSGVSFFIRSCIISQSILEQGSKNSKYYITVQAYDADDKGSTANLGILGTLNGSSRSLKSRKVQPFFSRSTAASKATHGLVFDDVFTIDLSKNFVVRDDKYTKTVYCTSVPRVWFEIKLFRVVRGRKDTLCARKTMFNSHITEQFMLSERNLFSQINEGTEKSKAWDLLEAKQADAYGIKAAGRHGGWIRLGDPLKDLQDGKRSLPTETTFANTKDLLVSNEHDTRILVDGVYWRERDHTLSKRFIDIV